MAVLTCVQVPRVDITSLKRKGLNIFFAWFTIIHIIHFIRIILQVDALLKTLELHGSAQHKGHFSLFNCLVIGHTKYKGVQRVYCNPFPAKTVPWKSLNGPRHDKAAGYRQWGFRCLA